MSDKYRTEYVARVNKVIDYIEEFYSSPLSLEELAEVSGFSQFHFHRIFSSLTGETLNRFIQRIRVEKAVAQLINYRDKSITDIAYDCGFSSSATFARVFKEVYKTSAGNYRKEWYENSRNCKTGSKKWKDFNISNFYIDPIQNSMKWRLIMKDEKRQFNVEVKDFNEMHAIYVRHTGPYAGDQEQFREMLGKIFKWAAPRGLMGKPDNMLMSVYHDHPQISDPSNQRHSVCLTVPSDTEVSGEIGKMKIPAGKYAVGHFELKDGSEHKAAWETMYGGWLPESGFQPAEGLFMDIYRNDPTTHPEGIHIIDICIPVKPI